MSYASLVHFFHLDILLLAHFRYHKQCKFHLLLHQFLLFLLSYQSIYQSKQIYDSLYGYPKQTSPLSMIIILSLSYDKLLFPLNYCSISRNEEGDIVKSMHFSFLICFTKAKIMIDYIYTYQHNQIERKRLHAVCNTK